MPWSAIVLGLGALVYGGLLGPLGVTFDATPLLFGAIALAAALLGRNPRLTAAALTLIGWGAAVMLTRHGPLPDEREAAAFLVGGGLGLLTARLVARRRPDLDLGDGSSVLVVGGMAFFLAFDAEMALRLADLERVPRRMGALGVAVQPAQASSPGDCGRRGSTSTMTAFAAVSAGAQRCG